MVLEVRPASVQRDDLVMAAVLSVGAFGLVVMLINPVNVATWILGPFMAIFVAVGLWYFRLRMLGRVGLRLDRSNWTALGDGRPMDFQGPVRAEAVESTYYSNHRQRSCHAVEFTSPAERFVVAKPLNQAEAESLAEAINQRLGWE